MIRLLALAVLVLLSSGCGTRVIITTGTTIGLKATPGDGSSRPPQVTFGYKRAEASIVPTRGSVVPADEDAFSTLAAFHFQTRFFGKTELDSFIGTGRASRDIQQGGFVQEIAEAVRVFQDFRFHNRAQLASIDRLSGTYPRLNDAQRTAVRDRAAELGLVAAGTSDDGFIKALAARAVGGLRPTTEKLAALEDFAATVR